MPIREIVRTAPPRTPKTTNTTHLTRAPLGMFDQYKLAFRLQQVIQDLKDTLAERQDQLDKDFPCDGRGVGLAADQIKYPTPPYPPNFTPPNIYIVSIKSERAFIESCEPVPPSVYINASYTPINGSEILKEETCFSMQGFRGVGVPRYESIRVSAHNEKGEPLEFTATGFVARVHQRAIDHCQDNEYLTKLNFTVLELTAILTWIAWNKQNPDPLDTKNWVNPRPEPIWVVREKLKCTSNTPDFDALQAWVTEALAEKNFHPSHPDNTAQGSTLQL